MTLETKKTIWVANTCSHGSLEDLKDWVIKFQQNIEIAGLVQTSDSGQIDISERTSLLGAGQDYGYLIYRFNDSEKNENPIFIKFTLYVGQFGGSTYTIATMAVEIGSSTNGAGTIIGSKISRFNYYNSGAGSIREFISSTPSFAIHSEGRFAIALGVGSYKNTLSNGRFFCGLYLDIQRFKSTDGVSAYKVIANSEAYYPSTPSANEAMVVKKTTLGGAFSLPWDRSLTPYIGRTDAQSIDGYQIVQRTYYEAPCLTVDPCLVMYANGVITNGDIFTAAVDGIERKYIALGSKTGMDSDMKNYMKISFGMLWDDL